MPAGWLRSNELIQKVAGSNPVQIHGKVDVAGVPANHQMKAYLVAKISGVWTTVADSSKTADASGKCSWAFTDLTGTPVAGGPNWVCRLDLQDLQTGAQNLGTEVTV